MTPVDQLSPLPTSLSLIMQEKMKSSGLDSDMPDSLNSTFSEPEYLNKNNHDHGVIFVVILALTMIIFFLLALVGNVLVILTIIRHKGMKTRTNMFIANLAVADILVALFNMPFSFATVIYGGWIFGEEFCQFNGFLVPLFFIVSIHTLIYISIHKYISITRPFSHTMTPRKIMVMIGATWLWGIICATATLKGGNHVVYKKGASQCGPSIPDELNEYIHSLIITTCNYIIPLIVMSFCYYNIFREIHVHLIRIRETSNVDLQNTLRQQRRISFTLFLVLSCFLVCWTPFIGYSCAAAFSKHKDKIPLWSNPVAYWCGYMNSACNPVIYALRSPSFRQGYKEIICSQATYALGASTITRPSLSPFPSLLVRSRKRLSDRGHLSSQNIRLLASPTKSVATKKRVPLGITNWSSFPSLHLRSLRKDPFKALVSSNSHGNILMNGQVKHSEYHRSNHASMKSEPIISEDKCLPKNSSFRRAISTPSLVEMTRTGDHSFSIEQGVIKTRFQCITSCKSENNICSTNHEDTTTKANLFDNLRKLPLKDNRTEASEDCKKAHFTHCPLVIINNPSPESVKELTSGMCIDGYYSDGRKDVIRDFAPGISISRSCSDEGRSQDTWNATAFNDGQWSPASIKSLEMGRNRRRSSKFKAKTSELDPLTKREKEPESPLYSASREQLMKWMSQDCLDRLEMIEQDFSKRFSQRPDSSEISGHQMLTNLEKGKVAS